MAFRVIQGSPCNAQAAPYFAVLVKDSGATVNSIDRSREAASILHAHGKHTQAEVFATSPPGVANPPGRSTHERRSDGVAYPGPVGRRLQWWQQGIDVNDSDVHLMMVAAHARGWHLVQPYKAGVEFHHLNFARKPRPKGPRTMAKLIRIRATLPRR
jgi:hypothetical protein